MKSSSEKMCSKLKILFQELKGNVKRIKKDGDYTYGLKHKT